MVMALVAPRRDPPSIDQRLMGARLQSLRKARSGKTQRQVGEALGLDHKTISAYENGHAVIGADDFPKWADALGVSVAELTASLGLGLPQSTTQLREALAGALGPDKAEILEDVVEEIKDWPESEQDFVIALFKSQVLNWPRRPSRG